MNRLDALAVPLSGNNLIEASAGTGKTYAITTLYLRFLLEQDIKVENILVVTYTRAATAELRDRIRGRIREMLAAISLKKSDDATLAALLARRIEADQLSRDEKKLRLALSSFDQAAIFTIHGFCQRTLQEAAFESGVNFDSEFDTDTGSLIDELTVDLWARELYDAEELYYDYLKGNRINLSTFRALVSRGIGAPELRVLPEDVEEPALGDEELKHWQRSFDAARSIWASEREGIVELVVSAAEAKELSGARYKRSVTCGSVATATDELLRGTAPRPASAKNAAWKLSSSMLATGTSKKGTAPSHPFFDAMEEFRLASEQVAASFEGRRLALLKRIVSDAPTEAKRRKLERKTQSFDDLLYQLRDALRSNSGPLLASNMRRSYRAALIDEFQDTDPVQYEIFKTVYGRDTGDSALFLIGDPKQAIYAFRGADLFTYFEAADDARERSHTLDINWRSDPGVVAGVNALFEHASRPFVYEKLGFSPVEHSPRAKACLDDEKVAPVELCFIPREEGGGDKPKPMGKPQARALVRQELCAAICAQLNGEQGIGGRPLEPSDIAVLVRTKSQARAVQAELALWGVPSVIEGGASVFESHEAEELERLMRGIVEARDRRRLRAALATDLLGFSGNELDLIEAEEERWQNEVQDFRAWHRMWRERGFIQTFWHILDSRAVTKRLLQWADGQRRLTNIHHLAELLQEQAQGQHSGPELLLRWLSNMRRDAATRAREGDESELRLESDDDAVRLVTIHKSKGLEYPVVYCPFLWDSGGLKNDDRNWFRFHDPDASHQLCLNVDVDNNAPHKALAEREALAEDLRLLYVAVTRAKHHCSITVGSFNQHEASGLAYLLFGGGEAGDDLKGWKKELKAKSDDELLAALLRFEEAAGGSLGVRRAEPREPQPYRRPSSQARPLEHRELTRSLQSHQRSSSFSGLTQKVEHERDHDAHTSGDRQSLGLDLDATAQGTGPVRLSTMPRGATAGQMIHQIFELLDFRESEPDAIRQQCRESLQSFGFDQVGLESTLTETIPRILQTPLAPESFRLADLAPQQRLDELEFNIPVRPTGILNAAMLASALAQRGAPPWQADYLSRVQALDFKPLSGFLKGFMDLVFVHEGRFYLVDYKSNDLGDRAGHYGAAAMRQSMAEHHYFLQYHLYLVALQRYLELRLPGYDYEQHMGGVFYLYLRGMDPDHAPGSGVFYDRPSAEELRLLDRTLRSAEGAER